MSSGVRVHVVIPEWEDVEIDVWALGIDNDPEVLFWKTIKGKGQLHRILRVADEILQIVQSECNFCDSLSTVLPLPPPDLHSFWPVWEVAALVASALKSKSDTSYLIVLDKQNYKKALEESQPDFSVERVLGVRDFSYKMGNILLLGGTVGSVFFVEEILKLLVEEGGVRRVFAVFAGIYNVRRLSSD